MEWQKTPGGTVREWEGGSICRRASTTPEWSHCPWGTKPLEWILRMRECRGKADGRGGDRNLPTNRSSGGNDKRMGGPRTALPPRPQQGTAADTNIAGTRPRNTAGTDGNRPEHGALARCEYGLLAPIGTAVDPSDQGRP